MSDTRIGNLRILWNKILNSFEKVLEYRKKEMLAIDLSKQEGDASNLNTPVSTLYYSLEVSWWFTQYSYSGYFPYYGFQLLAQSKLQQQCTLQHIMVLARHGH